MRIYITIKSNQAKVPANLIAKALQEIINMPDDWIETDSVDILSKKMTLSIKIIK